MDKAVASGLEGPWFDPCLRLFIFFIFIFHLKLIWILTIMFCLTYVIVNFIIQKLKKKNTHTFLKKYMKK